jgi:hypothetical protein
LAPENYLNSPGSNRPARRDASLTREQPEKPAVRQVGARRTGEIFDFITTLPGKYFTLIK